MFTKYSLPFACHVSFLNVLFILRIIIVQHSQIDDITQQAIPPAESTERNTKVGYTTNIPILLLSWFNYNH